MRGLALRLCRRPDIASTLCAAVFWPWVVAGGVIMFEGFDKVMPLHGETAMDSGVWDVVIVGYLILPVLVGVGFAMWSFRASRGSCALAVVGGVLNGCQAFCLWFVVTVSIGV